MNNNIKKYQYKKNKILFSSIHKNPLDLFKLWFFEACDFIKKDPNAFVLSTVNSMFYPSSRVVLLKDFSEKGFVFFTNYNSKKGRDIRKNNNVCLNFFWRLLERQIRIRGVAEKLKTSESVKYFDLENKKVL